MFRKPELFKELITPEQSSEIESKVFEIYGDQGEDIYKSIMYDIFIDLQNGLEPVKLNVKLLGWNHQNFQDILFRQKEQDEFIVNPFEVEEGVLKCPKCSQSRTFSYAKQTRSADEPMTTFATCMNCKYKWTYSG